MSLKWCVAQAVDACLYHIPSAFSVPWVFLVRSMTSHHVRQIREPRRVWILHQPMTGGVGQIPLHPHSLNRKTGWWVLQFFWGLSKSKLFRAITYRLSTTPFWLIGFLPFPLSSSQWSTRAPQSHHPDKSLTSSFLLQGYFCSSSLNILTKYVPTFLKLGC